MKFNNLEFEKIFKIKMPAPLMSLFSDTLLADGAVRFEFSDKVFVVEIQYLYDLLKIKEEDVKKQMYHFAVTTDGHDLLVNLSSQNLDIFQREFEDLESLEITINDLNSAKKVLLLDNSHD